MRGPAMALSLLLLAPAAVLAQPVQVDVPPPAPAAAPDAPKRPHLEVVRLTLPPLPAQATSTSPREQARQLGPEASLGESIELKTSPDLENYLEYAAERDEHVTLFLDGNDTGILPEEIDRETGTLRFHLERNSVNTKVWAALLRDPFDNQTREVKASVGLAGGVAAPASRSTFTLVVVKWAWYAYVWLGILVAVLVALLWLAAKRDILRDGPRPCPYSLGRCQMAFWFVLILSGYVIIWLITGNQDTITPSLLALMGISSLTALGSVLIESAGGDAGLSQAATDRLALQAAQQNAQQVEAAAREAADKAPADPVVQKQLGDAQAAVSVVGAKLLAVNATINGLVAPPVTRGFFRDIVSDSNGTAALHRFQMIVWTVVLGIIFWVDVAIGLSMPEFSATLLATMGISAGTYLGFKFPEK